MTPETSAHAAAHHTEATATSHNATIKPIFDLSGIYAYVGKPGPKISVSGNLISVDMSAYGRPVAHGSVQSSTKIHVNFPDDTTYTGQLQHPWTIHWSNHTTWVKVEAAVPDVVGDATDTPGPHPAKVVAATVLEAAGFRPVFVQHTTGPLVTRQSPQGESIEPLGSSVSLWRGPIVP